MVPLDALHNGEEGWIAEIDGESHWVVRLQEMGLRRGTAVRMVKAGSPCLIAVNGQRLSLRIDELTTILVEFTPPADACQ